MTAIGQQLHGLCADKARTAKNGDESGFNSVHLELRQQAAIFPAFYRMAAAAVEGRRQESLDSSRPLFLFCSDQSKEGRTMPESKTYRGQCHCGAVQFDVTTDLGSMGDCNCSRCRRLGWVLQPAPASQFTLRSGADNLTQYRFNTESIAHLFCRTCGVESFARGQDGQGVETVMINVNCLEPPVPVDRGAIQHWDGANW